MQYKTQQTTRCISLAKCIYPTILKPNSQTKNQNPIQKRIHILVSILSQKSSSEGVGNRIFLKPGKENPQSTNVPPANTKFPTQNLSNIPSNPDTHPHHGEKTPSQTHEHPLRHESSNPVSHNAQTHDNTTI